LPLQQVVVDMVVAEVGMAVEVDTLVVDILVVVRMEAVDFTEAVDV
jgi:hypothetical protein